MIQNIIDDILFELGKGINFGNIYLKIEIMILNFLMES